MGFPQVIGRTNSATASNNTSHVVAFPAVPTDGDLLLAFVVFDGGGTPTWPSGWTSVFLRRPAGGQCTAELRYRVASGDGASVAVTTSSEEMQARTWLIAKGTFANPPEIAFGVSVGSSAAPNPPPLAPAWGADKAGWLALIGADASAVVSNPPSGWTSAGAANSGGAGGVGIGYAERQHANASDDPSAVTLTPSAPWIAATVALRGRIEATIRADVAAWIEARLDGLAALQGTYSAAHGGRFFQGIAWNLAADGADVDAVLTLAPTDQAETWSDFGASLPSRVPAALAIDVYQSAGGVWGYTVRAMIQLSGVVWVRVWSGSSDPENRAVDWYADVEPVTG